MATRSPKVALRQACVQELSVDWPPGRFLELGAGIGLTTRLFLEQGFTGSCYDPDATSQGHLREQLQRYGARIEVLEDIDGLTPASFDYLLAFEVLEHSDDDHGALARWSRLLRSKGRLMVSVPAHRRKFGASDERVGHVRRDDRADLCALLGAGGYRLERLVNYGFPVTEVSRRLANHWFERTDGAASPLPREARSLHSSYNRSRATDRALDLMGERAYRPFIAVQRWFYGLDLGDGLVAVAVRAADASTAP